MSKLFLIALSAFLLTLFLFSKTAAAAAFPFGTGYYINLYGGGADPNGNIGDYNGEAACDISTGTCMAQNRNTGQMYPDGNVQRYVCSGKQLNCDNSHTNSVISGPEYAKTLSITNQPCDRTVQLDVFDSMNGNMKGYMTWYSGECPKPTPTAAPTPTPATPTPEARVSQVKAAENPTPTPMPRPLYKARRLPATGLPAIVWLVTGVIPLGFLLMGAKKKV